MRLEPDDYGSNRHISRRCEECRVVDVAQVLREANSMLLSALDVRSIHIFKRQIYDIVNKSCTTISYDRL